MSTDRETEIEELLKANSDQQVPRLLVELLALRREKYRDKLEKSDNPDTRGRAKECRDLSDILH